MPRKSNKTAHVLKLLTNQNNNSAPVENEELTEPIAQAAQNGDIKESQNAPPSVTPPVNAVKMALDTTTQDRLSDLLRTELEKQYSGGINKDNDRDDRDDQDDRNDQSGQDDGEFAPIHNVIPNITTDRDQTEASVPKVDSPQEPVTPQAVSAPEVDSPQEPIMPQAVSVPKVDSPQEPVMPQTVSAPEVDSPQEPVISQAAPVPEVNSPQEPVTPQAVPVTETVLPQIPEPAQKQQEQYEKTENNFYLEEKIMKAEEKAKQAEEKAKLYEEMIAHANEKADLSNEKAEFFAEKIKQLEEKVKKAEQGLLEERTPINLAEELVKIKVLEFVAKMGGCSCKDCYNDIVALTLNSIRPQYTVTKSGTLISKITAYEKQISTDFTSALTKAYMTVNNSPRHFRK